MIGIALALALAQPAEPMVGHCPRWGGEDLRACEIERGENDILDAVGSVPAHRLGDGAIRFSSMPALGGDAYVLELRPHRRGGARASFTWLYGHQGWRWQVESRWAFEISPTNFRDFTAAVSDAAARIRRDRDPVEPGAPETMMVCTDGPGFLTEFVRDGRVFTMTGFCPRSREEDHPHRAVEAEVLDIICPRFRAAFNPADGIGADCVHRDRRMRSTRR